MYIQFKHLYTVITICNNKKYVYMYNKLKIQDVKLRIQNFKLQ